MPLSRLVKFKNNGTLALADQAIASAANFITAIIIARHCTTGEFGLYVLGFSVVLIAFDIQAALLATPYMIHSPRLGSEPLRRYLGATLTLHLVVSGVFAVGLFLAASIFDLRGTESKLLASVLTTLAWAIVVIAARDFIRKVCFAHMRMLAAILLDVCVAAIQIGGLALLAWEERLSARLAYCIIGLACATAVVGWLSLNQKHFTVAGSDIRRVAADNWRLGKWVLLSGAAWTITMNAFPWILNALLGATATALWGACLGVTASSNPLLQGTLNYVGPEIARSYAAGDHEELRRAVTKCNTIVGATVLPVCLVLTLGGGFLIQLLYSHKYAGNGVVVAVLAVGMAANTAVFTYSRALFVLNRASIDFAVNLAGLTVSIVFGIPLVRWLGVIGAGVTLAAVGICGAVLKIIAFQSVTRGRSSRTPAPELAGQVGAWTAFLSAMTAMCHFIRTEATTVLPDDQE